MTADDERMHERKREARVSAVPAIAWACVALLIVTVVLSVVAFRLAEQVDDNQSAVRDQQAQLAEQQANLEVAQAELAEQQAQSARAARGSCTRGNEIRRRLNDANRAIYDAVTLTAAQAARNGDPGALRLWNRIAADATYSPPAECDRAQTDPTYRAPLPVPWTERPANVP